MKNANPATATYVFLLSILLTPASPHCRIATASECQKNPGSIPSYILASRGFDITTLSLSQYDVLDFSQWKYQNGSCTLCENPLLEGKPLQRLPLGISDWKANITCQQKVQRTIVLSCSSLANIMTERIVRNDWKEMLDVKLEPGASIQLTFAGADSRWVSFCKQRTEDDKYIFLLHHVSCSYYKFHISSVDTISEALKNTIKNLPEKFDSLTKWSYNEIILRYGTHFMTDIDLGARVNYVTGIEICRIPLQNYSLSEISRCLEIEAGVLMGFDKITKDPNFQECKQNRRKIPFLSLVSHHLKDLEGGQNYHSDLSDQVFNFPKFSENWLESTRYMPSLLSTSLKPLHTLLDENDIRRETLKQAIRNYMSTQALMRNCSFPCPQGVQHGAWDPCSCECPDNNFTSSMCCSQQPGLAKLTITILYAKRLWGDFFTDSDGYVSVSLQNKRMCTRTIWNNNNPVWNTSMDLGLIKLEENFAKVKVEVWDEDSGWNDDLLGKCWLTLRPWEQLVHICQLNHGTLHYKGHLVCGYHLGGPSCRDYLPIWPKERKINHNPWEDL